MQELFFFLAGWVEVGHCVPNVFIYVAEKFIYLLKIFKEGAQLAIAVFSEALKINNI